MLPSSGNFDTVGEMGKLSSLFTKHRLFTPIVLGFIFTLLTGLWEYEYILSFGIFPGYSKNIFRGLPLPYWNAALEGHPFTFYTFLLDILAWSILSFLLLHLLARLQKK